MTDDATERMRLVIIQLVFGLALLIAGMFFIDPTRFVPIDMNLRIALMGIGLALLYFKDGLMLLANSVITLAKNYKTG